MVEDKVEGKLVPAHELFLGQIEVVFLANQADSAILERCCKNLASIIIPPDCLKGVEEKLVELLVAKSQIDESTAEKAWEKACILREAIRSIQSRLKKPKPKKKPKKKGPQDAPKPAPDPLTLAGVEG